MNMWDPIPSAAGTRPCSLGSNGVEVVVSGPVGKYHLHMRRIPGVYGLNSHHDPRISQVVQ